VIVYRPRMRKFAIIAGMLLAFGACKKNKWDDALSKTEGFRDQMCACKDKACTEDVHKKYKEWEKSMMADMGKDEKPPDGVVEKAGKTESETWVVRRLRPRPKRRPPVAKRRRRPDRRPVRRGYSMPYFSSL